VCNDMLGEPAREPACPQHIEPPRVGLQDGAPPWEGGLWTNRT